MSATPVEQEVAPPPLRPFDNPVVRRSTFWAIVAAALMAVGVTGAVAAADHVASRDAERASVQFERSSNDVVSTLQLAVQRQEDLVVNASGLIAANPRISEPDFAEWATLTKVFDRYPEVLGFGFAVIVASDELAAFVEKARRERSEQLAPDGSLVILPEGERLFYCLTELQLNRSGVPTPIGTDWCEPNGLSLTARDSGATTYTPIVIGADTFLSVNVPVFEANAPLNTVEERRSAFIGWVGTVSTPQLVLDRAARSHPGVVVSMEYHSNTSDVEFLSGPVPQTSGTATVDLGNGWTITTFAEVAHESLLAHRESRTALVALTTLSVAIAALVFVLGTGRARAVRLVTERTGELRYRALHDELTGLPNRALIMDRLDHLMTRNRRNGWEPAALYIDIDDFKNVNDSLGHQAGDHLLTEVAARLTSAVRTADTVGRMGGDEFVVLIDGDHDIDGNSGLHSPGCVAERLLEVMREPFDLTEVDARLVVNTSIGIATGDRASGGDLLRDADVALYEAKAAGKNRYCEFCPSTHHLPDATGGTQLQLAVGPRR